MPATEEFLSALQLFNEHHFLRQAALPAPSIEFPNKSRNGVAVFHFPADAMTVC